MANGAVLQQLGDGLNGFLPLRAPESAQRPMALPASTRRPVRGPPQGLRVPPQNAAASAGALATRRCGDVSGRLPVVAPPEQRQLGQRAVFRCGPENQPRRLPGKDVPHLSSLSGALVGPISGAKALSTLELARLKLSASLDELSGVAREWASSHRKTLIQD